MYDKFKNKHLRVRVVPNVQYDEYYHFREIDKLAGTGKIIALVGEVVYGLIATPIIVYFLWEMLGAFQTLPGASGVIDTGKGLIILVLGLGEVLDLALIYFTLASD